jgi:hypothetical protein
MIVAVAIFHLRKSVGSPSTFQHCRHGLITLANPQVSEALFVLKRISRLSSVQPDELALSKNVPLNGFLKVFLARGIRLQIQLRV